MKRVTLIRHAQAEDAVGQADFDRILTRRGAEDAAEMARRFKQNKFAEPLLISSTAARAVASADIFARALRISAEHYRRDDRLYTAGPADYLKILRECDDAYMHVIVVAHNPSIAETADKLCSERSIEGLPTAGIVTMTFDINRWQDLQWSSGTDVDVDYPARY